MAWRSAGGAVLLMLACAAEQRAQPTPMVAPALPPSATGAISEDKSARARLLMLRAEASEIADAPQAAAEAYTAAITLVPDQPRYYLRLAEVYRSVRASAEAELVLAEGVRSNPGDSAVTDRARMLLLLAGLASERGDGATTRGRLAQVAALSPQLAPELSLEIGLRYVGLPAATPSDLQIARQQLARFKATCGPAGAAANRDRCDLAESLLQRISSAPEAPSGPAVAAELPTSGGPPRLPTPRLKLEPLRSDDAFTVWGAGYFLRSRHHRSEVDNKRISVRGFIVKTNFADAPPCAVHRAGIADPEDCRADIPTFWLADRPDAPLSDAMPVMGFASNYAQLYEAILLFESDPEAQYADDFWGVQMPNPLPARGAEVVVTGRFGQTFAKSSSGHVESPVLGILDHQETRVIQAAPVRATLPGIKRK